MQTGRAEKITITLQPDMLALIKRKIDSGSYSSAGVLVREAIKLWQQKEEEREARLDLIRNRLARSAKSEDPVPLYTAFQKIEECHLSEDKNKST